MSSRCHFVVNIHKNATRGGGGVVLVKGIFAVPCDISVLYTCILKKMFLFFFSK